MRRFAAALLCAALAAAQAQPVVLALRINGEDQGEVFAQRQPDGGFLVRRTDLATAGLVLPASQPQEGDAWIDLRQVGGLAVDFDASQMRLALQADSSLLPHRTLSVTHRGRFTLTPVTRPSAFLNYAVESLRESGPLRPAGTSLAVEAGLHSAGTLWLANGGTVQGADGRSRFVRLMTSATRDDPGALRRWVAGDFFVTPFELGRGALLGGVGMTKLYGLDPTFQRAPGGSFKAQVALPGELDVYVDGQRVRSERVRPGEVEVRDLSAWAGARNVQLVVRDAFGRVERFDHLTYVSDRPLRAGLHDYSWQLGALRRDYGSASDRYGPLAVSVQHRYGVSDALTLGFTAQGRRELANAGTTATVALGPAGVLGLAVSGSEAAGRRGWAGALHYTYQRRDFSAGLSLRRDSAAYAMLSDPLALEGRKRDVSANASYSFGAAGNVSLQHARLTLHDSVPPPGAGWRVALVEPRRATTVGYSAPLVPGRAAWSATATRVNDRLGSRNEFGLNLDVFFEGQRSVRAGSQRQRDFRADTLQVAQAIPVGEGWGWDVFTAATPGEGLQLKASAQLNLPHAMLRAEAIRQGAQGGPQDALRASVAGSLAWIGGGLHFGRPVTDSYALLRAAGVAGLPATLNGRPLGRTDAAGVLFVPNLDSYQDNQLALETRELPIEYSVASIARTVTPPLRAGLVVDFEAKRLRAVTGTLVDARGAPLALASIELPGVGGRAVRTQSGRRGEIYVEDLGAGSHEGTARIDGIACRFRIELPPTEAVFIEAGKVVCD